LKPVSSEVKEGLAFLAEQNGDTIFAYTEDLLTFEYGVKVPDDFPVSGFSLISNNSFNNSGIINTLFGGKSRSGAALSTVWSTENGYYWTKLSTNLPLIEGGNAFLYNNEIWFAGGKSRTGDYNKEIYYSQDGGLVWKPKATKAQAPAEFPLRTNASVLVDDNGIYFYIAGGENPSAQTLTDIWKVALNFQIFKE
jgi:hypothetical protein